ncbi:MAG: hypothetical protein QF524_04035, partial [Planctomycetota bacterium]|nr:hypothetical protein [Planctomycetota bacterium]
GPVSPLVIAYSFSGGGPTQTGFGFSLDLTLPILKTPIMLADLSGTLVIHQMVPTSIPTGTPIWFQAIEIRASGSPPQLDCVLSPGLALTVL